MMEILELDSYSATDVPALDALMHQLSATSCCTEKKLDDVISDSNSHLYVAREDGNIIATATLCVSHTPEFTIGGIEAVVVDSANRGRGIAKLLMQHILKEAKRFGCVKLHLTSNPQREAANRLYQNIGFRRKETNCYTMEL